MNDATVGYRSHKRGSRIFERAHRRGKLLAHWPVVVAILVYAGLPGAAFSQNAPAHEDLDCVDPTNEEYSAFHHALDPGRKFWVDVGPYRFAVPWKYLHPRPAKFLAGCKIRSSALSIQFWIPDGEAPERDLFWNSDYNPPETARPYPLENEWVIKFVNISYYPIDPPAQADPETQFKNIVQLFGKDISVKRDGDLEMVEFNDPSNTAKYWLKAEGNTSMFFWCGSSDVCKGTVTLKDKQLAGQFLLKKPSIRFNSTIASTFQKLLQQWGVIR